jgi:integrase
VSDRKRTAAKQKITRRRDDDPVKISNDFRVSWYPGGVPGKGNKRRQQRCKSREEAEAFAAERHAEIDRHRSRGPLSHEPLGAAYLRFVTFLGTSNTPQGTTDQYRSNWRCHMPEAVADVPCGDLNVGHWTQVFEEMLIDGASKETMRAVARTLGALITYAENRNYFGDRDAFGVSARRRRGIVADLAKRAPAAADQDKIGVEHCPAPATIHRFARVAESVLPGYGILLVLLAFASGLRFTECLGLRVEHIDLRTGEIRVVQQLNRYQAWPAVAPPKGGKSRAVQIWAAYEWVLHRLVAQAATHTGDHEGWLFPPDRKVKRWADRVNRLINQDSAALYNDDADERGETGDGTKWGWTFHWLRHAHASYSLASKEHGGLGFSVTYVQGQLGHAKPTTTTDRYQSPIAGEADAARKMSRTLPWEITTDEAPPASAMTNQIA